MEWRLPAPTSTCTFTFLSAAAAAAVATAAVCYCINRQAREASRLNNYDRSFVASGIFA